ncbi:MAG: DUF4340 domain-containing protein [Planctomycetes bacterium]|nr:DUF4340 domain-containing protein [Planctomycetota bacterium]
MNFRVTLAVLGVLVVLTGIVVGLDRFNVGQPQTKEGEKDQELTIFQFDDRQVAAFVGRVADTTVRIEKAGEVEWKIADSGEPADRLTLSSLLIRMSQLKGTKRVGDPGGDLQQFGLAEPRSEATAELDDGTRYALQIGDKTPVGTGSYAKRADSDDVFVLPAAFASDLERLVKSPKEPPTPTPRPSPTSTPESAATPIPSPSP